MSQPPFSALEPTAPRRLSVLVVDDEQSMRDMLQHVLESAGHRVVCAAGGRDVPALLVQRAFDVVLTDVLMPNGDGLEVIIAARRTQPKARVFAMSGGGSFLAADDCLRAARGLGVQGILHKPFRPEGLLEKIEAAVDGVPAFAPSAAF